MYIYGQSASTPYTLFASKDYLKRVKFTNTVTAAACLDTIQRRQSRQQAAGFFEAQGH